MTVIERSALLPHAAEQVFDLVADIERYPEFLEGCVGAEIHERGEETVTATLPLVPGRHQSWLHHLQHDDASGKN